MITIKAIDIIQSFNKFIIRDIHADGRKGQVIEEHDTLYSESQALRRAKRRAGVLKVPFNGITEATA